MNYVTIVNKIMSYTDELIIFFERHNTNYILKLLSNNKLDRKINKAYFYLHNYLWRTRDDQNRHSQGIWLFQSTSRKSQGPLVSKQHFFRPSRPFAGALRDAPLCHSRKGFQDGRSSSFRSLSPNLLRRRSCICTGWLSGPVTPTTRTKRLPQAKLRRHGFSRDILGRRQKVTLQRSCRVSLNPFQHCSTPTQHRTSIGQKKIVQRMPLINLPENTVDLYESLRKQVLTGAIRPQGLCVVLHHGMLRGLQILAENPLATPTSPPESQNLSASLGSPLPAISPNADLVSILANLISSLHPEVRYAH
ncbi:MAG: hypothetical protein ACD_16C00223G0005 [uncultured bacterium]|nr:MAG: hypothetical protein ACD_16C00223G0005 [uncultured bacterium]